MKLRESAVAVTTATLLLSVFGAGAAHAHGYRYWSFWERDGGSWVYATQGPATARPADGDVQGFRFAVSEDSRDATRPRGAASFDAICADTPAEPGTKRVALVLDFGTPADAPRGSSRPPESRTECAQVPPEATSAESLAAVAKPLRYDSNALLCAISGYPEKGCGDQVAEAHAAGGEANDGREADGEQAGAKPSDRPSDGGPSAGLLTGLVVITALGAAALWQSRRRG
ncbi:SCO2322 family protein [Streptomyces pathocidini]|uniref:SCO2322 family protein n=1 Tax=Streptomyces pathocidini TaxID=1650571 RepID=A0ABW7URP0_9ACTN|nr:SCO2322 family protein [Streptomyces pathocidini]